MPPEGDEVQKPLSMRPASALLGINISNGIEEYQANVFTLGLTRVSPAQSTRVCHRKYTITKGRQDTHSAKQVLHPGTQFRAAHCLHLDLQQGTLHGDICNAAHHGGAKGERVQPFGALVFFLPHNGRSFRRFGACPGSVSRHGSPSHRIGSSLSCNILPLLLLIIFCIEAIATLASRDLSLIR
jgi:hypothetical protein